MAGDRPRRARRGAAGATPSRGAAARSARSAGRPPAALPRAVRQRVYSQNFLTDRRVIEALAGAAGVEPGDLVLDIGAGNGLITAALARRGARVVAIERDPVLVRRLRSRFGPEPGVTVVAGDVLTAPLPGEEFAVVANIPFGITTKILRRLLGDPAALLRRADLIVQAQVARKRGGAGRGQGTLLNAIWEPWFEFGVGPVVPRSAFRPQPGVDGAVLIIARRARPLLDPAQRDRYAAFVTAAFNQARPTVASALTRGAPGLAPVGRARFAGLAASLGFPPAALPSQLEPGQWVGLFQAALARPAGGAAAAANPGIRTPPGSPGARAPGATPRARPRPDPGGRPARGRS